ncbi:hypothetical protein Tco_0695790 [Tanacetum coccineum]
MIIEFCLRDEFQRMEQEQWGLRVKDSDIPTYTNRFHELKLKGLQRIKRENGRIFKVESPATTITEITTTIISKITRDRENVRVITTAPTERGGYSGPYPFCNRCNLHYTGPYTVKCQNYQRVGHRTRDCRSKFVATGANTQPIVSCYSYGERRHIQSRCPNKNDQQTGNARGRVYVMKDGEQQQDPKVVTGIFLLNNNYATILFDLGANKSFLSTNFNTLIDFNTVKLDTNYVVELADGKIFSTNTILRVPEAAPVVRAPYRLTPTEMKELSEQLQELSGCGGTTCMVRSVRWIELLSDYDYDTRYHPGKANVVVDALSRKERIKPLRFRALVMMVHTNLSEQIINAQAKAMKEEKVEAENLQEIDKKSFETRPDGNRCLNKRAWLPLQLTSPEIVQETVEKIVQIKNHLLAARSHQKSYADVRHKPLEFNVCDMVMLKVLPWKGPRYIEPFKILARKCFSDRSLVISLDEIQLDDKLDGIPDEDLISHGSEKTNSKASTLISSQPPRQLMSPIEIWGLEFPNGG